MEPDIFEKFKSQIQKAKKIHETEKGISLESVFLIGEFERDRHFLEFGMSSERFAATIGITVEVYWKRAQAARTIERFPRSLELVKSKRVHLSHLFVIAGRLTPANEDLVLNFIPGKTRREILQFLARVTPSGQLVGPEASVNEIRFLLNEEQLKLLERAREVLAHSGWVPRNEQILETALSVLIQQRDPMEKAKRAEHRKESRRLSLIPEPIQDADASSLEVPEPVQGNDSLKSNARPPIPAFVQHEVWLRDQGRCTWLSSDGLRCNERMMLELDHIVMWCRGGKHSFENLRLRCKTHNLATAAMALKGDWIKGTLTEFGEWDVKVGDEKET